MKIVKVLLLVSATLLLSSCGNRLIDGEQVAPSQKLVLKFSHVTDENSPKGLAAHRFAQLVRERTKGYVEIQVFPNGQLYSDEDALRALQENRVQFIAPATTVVAKLAPPFRVFDLPYAFQSREDIQKVTQGPLGKQLFALLEPYDIKGLAYWTNGFKQMTNNRRPLIRPEEFQGLRFRCMNGKAVEDQFRALGAIPSGLPFNDVYQALEKGQLDGQENTLSNIVGKKLYQVQRYMTLSDHGYLGYAVLVNRTYWNRLPAAIREVLENTLAEVTRWEEEQSWELNAKALEEIQRDGSLQIHRLTDEEKALWQAQFRHLYDEMAREVGENYVWQMPHTP